MFGNYDSEDAEDDPLERVHAAYVEDYNFDGLEEMELMDTAEINGSDIEDFCQWPDLVPM